MRLALVLAFSLFQGILSAEAGLPPQLQALANQVKVDLDLTRVDEVTCGDDVTAEECEQGLRGLLATGAKFPALRVVLISVERHIGPNNSDVTMTGTLNVQADATPEEITARLRSEEGWDPREIAIWERDLEARGLIINKGCFPVVPKEHHGMLAIFQRENFPAWFTQGVGRYGLCLTMSDERALNDGLNMNMFTSIVVPLGIPFGAYGEYVAGFPARHRRYQTAYNDLRRARANDFGSIQPARSLRGVFLDQLTAHMQELLALQIPTGLACNGFRSLTIGEANRLQKNLGTCYMSTDYRSSRADVEAYLQTQ